MNYTTASPIVDKHVAPDGSQWTGAGQQVAPPSAFWAQWYVNADPIVAKWLLSDGSISTTPPAPAQTAPLETIVSKPDAHEITALRERIVALEAVCAQLRTAKLATLTKTPIGAKPKPKRRDLRQRLIAWLDLWLPKTATKWQFFTTPGAASGEST
jgi:hypothetical protein